MNKTRSRTGRDGHFPFPLLESIKGVIDHVTEHFFQLQGIAVNDNAPDRVQAIFQDRFSLHMAGSGNGRAFFDNVHQVDRLILGWPDT